MNQLPGYELGRTVTPREILASPTGDDYLPGGVVLDATNGIDGANTSYTYEIRAGWLLGRITASGLYVPCKRTTANGAGTTATALIVVNAAAFKAADSIKVGSNVAQAIVSVNYGTNTITLTSAITWSSGDAVIAQDGSQTCVGILAEHVKLKNYDNTAAQNKSAKMLIAGVVNKANLLGDVTAILADTGNLLKPIKMISNNVPVS